MFVLVMSPEKNEEFLVKVMENDIGELNIITTYFIEEATVFETEKDALEFKHDYSLRAWTKEL